MLGEWILEMEVVRVKRQRRCAERMGEVVMERLEGVGHFVGSSACAGLDCSKHARWEPAPV